jgi:hypothetical protein
MVGAVDAVMNLLVLGKTGNFVISGAITAKVKKDKLPPCLSN